MELVKLKDEAQCPGCSKLITIDSWAAMIDGHAHHMAVDCLGASARQELEGIGRADQRVTPTKQPDVEEVEDIGMRALADKLEPYYTGGARLDKTLIRKLVKQAVAEQPPVTISVAPTRAPVTEIALADHHRNFGSLVSGLAAGNTVWLTGPAGSGKSTACENAAKALGMELFVQTPCTDKFEMLGYEGPDGVYKETPLYRWLHTENALLIFDEIDGNDPRVMPTIHAIMAGGHVDVGGKATRMPEGNLFIANANTWGFGANSDYVGRNPLDGATTNRFASFIDWPYDDGFEKRLCHSLAMADPWWGAHKAAAKAVSHTVARAVVALRTAICKQQVRLILSPRDTLAMLRRVMAGMTPRAAIGLSAMARLPENVRDQLLEPSSVRSALDRAGAVLESAVGNGLPMGRAGGVE